MQRKFWHIWTVNNIKTAFKSGKLSFVLKKYIYPMVSDESSDSEFPRISGI